MSEHSPPDPAPESQPAPVDPAPGSGQAPLDLAAARSGEPSSARPLVEQLEQEGDVAADFLEALLDIADLDGDLELEVAGERAAVTVLGSDLRVLVGPDGKALDALQELTRLAVFQSTGVRSRLLLDIGGYRAEHRMALQAQAQEAVARVRESGQPERLAAMNSFERKVVHDVVAAQGLTSASEGEGANRGVVIQPR